MATVTRGESVNAAKTIRDETRARGNTRLRVGAMLVDMAESVAFTADMYGGATGYVARGMYVDIGAGVNIARFADRVFVGDAATQLSGNFTGGTTTSFTQANPGNSWMERDAQLVSSHQNGMIAIAGTSCNDRFATYPNAQACIGVLGAVHQTNSAASSNGAWAGYFDATVLEGVKTNGAYGLEIVAKDMRTGGSPVPHAYGLPGVTIGIWLAGGGDPAIGAPGGPSGAAIVIGKNGDTWHKGIIILGDGIEGSDGETGGQRSDAIELGLDHEISWRNKNSAATTPSAGSGIRYIGGGNNSFTRLLFENRAVRFVQSASHATVADEKPTFECVGPAAAVPANFVRCTATATGSGVTVSAQGTDSNIDLSLAPKGTGKLRDGTGSPIGPHGVSKTIASGGVTIAGTEATPILALTLDTESAAASDDLDVLSGGVDYMIVVLRSTDGARNVVVKHGTNNIFLNDGLDYTLDVTSNSLTLQKLGGFWRDIART